MVIVNDIFLVIVIVIVNEIILFWLTKIFVIVIVNENHTETVEKKGQGTQVAYC